MNPEERSPKSPALEDRARVLWVSAIFLFVLGDALTLQTRGPLLRSFEADFAVSEGILGLVAPAGTAGFVIAAILGGFLAGRINIKRWLVIGIGLTGLSLLLMSGAPIFPILLILLVGQGTAAGIVRGLDRPILSHLYPNHRGRMFALHSFAWAIGAVSGPLYINYMLSVGDWRLAYAILGVCFLPLILLVISTGMPSGMDAEQPFSIVDSREIFGRPMILGMAIAITLMGATEGIIFTWLPYYASEFMSLERANLVLTVFLLAYLPGRLLYTWLVDNYRSLPLAIVASGLALPPLAVTVGGSTGYSIYVAAFIAGFFWAGLFPLISTFGVEVAPKYSGPITAISAGGTYLGMGIGPLVVGFLAEQVGIIDAVQLLVVTAGAVFGVLVLTGIWNWRR